MRKLMAEEAFHQFVKPFMVTLENATNDMLTEDAIEFLSNVKVDVEGELDALIEGFGEDDDE